MCVCVHFCLRAFNFIARVYSRAAKETIYVSMLSLSTMLIGKKIIVIIAFIKSETYIPPFFFLNTLFTLSFYVFQRNKYIILILLFIIKHKFHATNQIEF